MRSIPLIALLAFVAAGCNPPAKKEAVAPEPAKPAIATKSKFTDVTKPIIKDIEVGKGAPADNGDKLFVLYKGTFPDGKEFESNYDPEKDVLPLVLGQRMVIQGWDMGLKGMKRGGVRKLEIPWQLAYGEAGSPPKIPAKQDLNFEVKLLYILKPGETETYDVEDTKIGTGAEAKKGNAVLVHYVGKFLNGKKFDSSVDRKEPIEFVIGKGSYIPGLEDGVIGMKPGGKRTLILPPALGYGPVGKGTIPPDAVLQFDVELLKILK